MAALDMMEKFQSTNNVELITSAYFDAEDRKFERCLALFICASLPRISLLMDGMWFYTISSHSRER